MGSPAGMRAVVSCMVDGSGELHGMRWLSGRSDAEMTPPIEEDDTARIGGWACEISSVGLVRRRRGDVGGRAQSAWWLESGNGNDKKLLVKLTMP